MVDKPLPVADPGTAAGHDTISIPSEAHHRDVGLDAARVVQQLPVDDTTDGHVDVGDSKPL